MTNFKDLQAYFLEQDFKMIIAADAETLTHRKSSSGKLSAAMSAGGVSTAFDPIAKASKATYIARAKTEEDREVVDKRGIFPVQAPDGNYLLKRLFVTDEKLEKYYYGFSNQTLWPLCHVSFVSPKFDDSWFEGFK
ncbi:MAG: trehalose-6-phosphate synthase, partial [Patescibacteria group bacterium]